jgi:hypothetical protein
MNRREFLAAGAALAAMRFPARDPFVVHEWGVVTVADGATWSRLRSAAGEGENLPGFVTTWETAVGQTIENWMNMPVRKPVVHFYSREKRDVELTVRVPTGRPEAWWPPAAEFGPKPDLPPRRGLSSIGEAEKGPDASAVKPENGLLRWSLSVDPDIAPATFPDVAADHWWATARKIASTPVSGDRFVFYDAMAPFDPGPAEPNVRVENGRAEGLSPADFEAMLREAGLYKEEAARVAEIWTPEFFQTDGVRSIRIVPREQIDALLPMEIAPAPDELVRVLIAHVEHLTPEREREVERCIADLVADAIETREAATRSLESFGPFAEGALRRALAETKDPEVQARIAALLKRLAP